MTKMRLTTLNLDQECVDILGGHENKSKYARKAIKSYAESESDADFYEEQYTRSLRKINILVKALAYNAESGEGLSLDAFLCQFLDVTDVQLAKIVTSGFTEHELRLVIDRLATV